MELNIAAFIKQEMIWNALLNLKNLTKQAKVLFDALKSEGDVLDCGTSKAGYIYLSVLSFILIILNL